MEQIEKLIIRVNLLDDSEINDDVKWDIIDTLNNHLEQLRIGSVSGSAYLAFMRIDYEGIYEDSMKLFKSKEDASKHIEALKEKHGTYSMTYEIEELHCH